MEVNEAFHADVHLAVETVRPCYLSGVFVTVLQRSRRDWLGQLSEAVRSSWHFPVRQTASFTQQLTTVDAVHRCRLDVLGRGTDLTSILDTSVVSRILQAIQPVFRNPKPRSTQRTEHIITRQSVLAVALKASETE